MKVQSIQQSMQLKLDVFLKKKWEKYEATTLKLKVFYLNIYIRYRILRFFYFCRNVVSIQVNEFFLRL